MGISGAHVLVVQCGAVGSVSALQKGDRLGYACCETRADASPPHRDPAVIDGVDAD